MRDLDVSTIATVVFLHHVQWVGVSKGEDRCNGLTGSGCSNGALYIQEMKTKKV